MNRTRVPTHVRPERTLQTVSAEYRKIMDYVKDLPPGAEVTYMALEQATGINMDSMNNRGKLRRVLNALKLAYRCDPGIGYDLAAPNTALSIADHYVRGVATKVQTADNVITILTNSFLPEMTQAAQRDLLMQKSKMVFLRAATGTQRGTQLAPMREQGQLTSRDEYAALRLKVDELTAENQHLLTEAQRPKPTEAQRPKCSVCGRDFATAQALGSHLASHRKYGRQAGVVV